MDERILKLRVGIVVLAAAIICGILIWRFGDIQLPGTSKYTIFINFTRAPGVTVGTPVPLFKIGEPLGTFAYPFDISSDGQKILALTPTSTAGDRALTVLVNWEAGLRK